MIRSTRRHPVLPAARHRPATVLLVARPATVLSARRCLVLVAAILAAAVLGAPTRSAAPFVAPFVAPSAATAAVPCSRSALRPPVGEPSGSTCDVPGVVHRAKPEGRTGLVRTGTGRTGMVTERGRPPEAAIVWRRSRALGRPDRGRLVAGVELPAAGTHFVTVDPVSGANPNRAWRRHGTDRLIQLTLRVAEEHAAAHPDAPRLVVGDLSRPRGGRFGREYGGDGHRSHQNGLDVDVWYPRRDGLEQAPTRVAQIDRRLAQELVDRFVRAGAQWVFVGPATGLRGPAKVVMTLGNHDDHLHVRIPPAPAHRSRR